MQTLINPVMDTNWRHAFITDREKTLAQIYAHSYPLVLHYVKQHNGTPEDAQDLLQEAIIVFYEKTVGGKLTLTASVSTYLMGICKNQWHQELEKRRRKQKQLPTDLMPLREETPAEPDNQSQNLLEFVAQLGKKCQDILVAFYYFGHNMPRIAQQHQYRNVHTATVQKFKCLERLRKSLAGFTIGDFS